MLVLAIKGSPRKKGNTDYLLGLFMAEARKRGWETEIIDAVKENFEPCIGCGNCERTGFCSIKDTMPERFFSPLRRADVVVVSVPTYFYAVPARIKALMDRTQTLWSRKYLFKIKDPGHDHRRGVLLAAAATHGRDLFDGIKLNVKYFLDAAGAAFEESLCYRGIDSRGAMEKHPTVHSDVALLAQKVLSPFERRKTWVFACRENAGRSQMAAAFARCFAGDRIEVISAGSAPWGKGQSPCCCGHGGKGHRPGLSETCVPRGYTGKMFSPFAGHHGMRRGMSVGSRMPGGRLGPA